MHVISRLFNKISFIFNQLCCSAKNMPAWTLSLTQLIAIYIAFDSYLKSLRVNLSFANI